MVDSHYCKRDILIRRRTQQLQRIVETHPSYDALQYPLIFWRGNDSYHIGLKQVDPSTGALTNKNLSCMDCHSHQLQIRDVDQNFVLRCGSLLSQFVVDMYAKIESQRLLFI